jgi:hypothetical protein
VRIGMLLYGCSDVPRGQAAIIGIRQLLAILLESHPDLPFPSL